MIGPETERRMKRYSLNQNWEYVEAALQNPLLVNMLKGWKKTDLPHDYSIEKGRDPKSPAGLDEGFFDGAGLYYKKTFILKEEAKNKRIYLEFEGISGMTEIWVNKQFAVKNLNPYASICIDVTDSIRIGENEIMVHTDSRMKPCSRWYVGAGIYRNVWLLAGEKCSIKPYSLRMSTNSLTKKQAVLNVCAEVTEETSSLRFELLDSEGNIKAKREGSGELIVDEPRAWNVQDPYLYTLRAIAGEDITEEKVGIRTIHVNAKKGLRINGESVKLKGGCIHHDLGLLGAADYEAAERRRISLLKESGYNAVRCAHNPFSKIFLKVCSEMGMMVIGEAFDEWVLGRTSFGLHMTFEDRWEKDLENMIAVGFNEPCIIMWSTGNEVEERDGSADGFAWAENLANKVRALDATRPVSASACALFSEYGNRPADGTTGNQALNMAYDTFAEGNDIWGPGTEKYFEPLDVAGYNYKSVRYAFDREKYPQRVIYGSESYPRAAYQTWLDTVNNDNVIGDFVWTAWDYLGEVGVGRWEVSEESRPKDPTWPWMSAGCSDIDLIGEKRPQSYYRDTLWKTDGNPKIFCLPPHLYGKNIARLSWGWLPVERNYTYEGWEGSTMEIVIYACADEVELFQNGMSQGRKALTENQASFSICYNEGSLEAIAYRNGSECGRDSLLTSGKTEGLSLKADRNLINADGSDLCFVTIEAVDKEGHTVYSENREIKVEVQGGTLLALGTADPKPEEMHPFTKDHCPLFNGKALAVVRSEKGGRGCLIKVSLKDEFGGQIGIGYIPVSEEESIIAEAKEGVMDLPLGELLENEAVVKVLDQYLPMIMNNPMLNAMRSMSLKKLLGMGAMPVPEGLSEFLENIFMK